MNISSSPCIPYHHSLHKNIHHSIRSSIWPPFRNDICHSVSQGSLRILLLIASFFGSPALAQLPVQGPSQVPPQVQAQSAVPKSPLSFPQALELAQKVSPEKKRAQFALRSGDLDRKLLDKQLDPVLQWTSVGSGRVGYTGPSSSGRARSGGASGGPSPNFEIGDEYALTFDQTHSLSLNQTLYDFGRLSAQRKRSDLQRKVVELRVSEVDDALRYRVARAYLKILTSQQIQRTIELQVRNAQKKLTEIERSYRRGEKSEVDFVKSQADAGRAQLAVKRSQDEVRVALDQLTVFFADVGNANAAGFVFPNLMLKSAQEWSKLVGTWGVQPFKNAIGVRRDAEREALDAQLPIIETSKKPVVSSQISAQLGGNLFPVRPSALAQLQFSYNIPWNGMENDEKEKVLLQKQDLLLQDDIDTKLRLDKLSLARSQIDVSLSQISEIQNQVKILERYQELVRKRYNAGKASALELSTTEDEVINSYLDLSRVQVTVSSAALDIAEAVGVTELGNLF